MSDIAMAAHHHHHHGAKASHWKLPSLSHLEAKLSSLVSVAQGQQGPGPQHMFFIGLVLLLILIAVVVRKARRS